MSTGVCQRPPLQWPEGVLAAGVCFPYVLTLLPQALHVYSLVDQQLKETVCLLGAKGLLPTKGTAGCHYWKHPSRVDMHFDEEQFIRIKIHCFCLGVCGGDMYIPVLIHSFVYFVFNHSSIDSFIYLCLCLSIHPSIRWGVCVHREGGHLFVHGASGGADPNLGWL